MLMYSDWRETPTTSGKQRHQISAPVVEQELVASDDQKQNGDVVAEAKFAE